MEASMSILLRTSLVTLLFLISITAFAAQARAQVGDPPKAPPDPAAVNPESPNAVPLPDSGTCAGCPGTAWSITNTGPGRAGYFYLNNTNSTNPALEGRSNSNAAGSMGVLGQVLPTNGG